MPARAGARFFVRPHFRPILQKFTVKVDYPAAYVLCTRSLFPTASRAARALRSRARAPKTVGIVLPPLCSPKPRPSIGNRLVRLANGPRRQSTVMMAGSDCDCLICRLETSLLDELSHEKHIEEYRAWAASNKILAAFPTSSELIAHLHRQTEEQNYSADEVIGELVRPGTNGSLDPIGQSLLLLVFVPTIHRTTTQIRAAFPSLGRDDTAQHLFAALLEFLRSPELRTHRSHLAFFVARKMRRSGFRWAIRESRLDLPTDRNPRSTASEGGDDSSEESHAGVLLAKFLDDCQRRGWLSEQERQLLTDFKLEGLTAAELAGRSGHSSTAVHRRIQRLVDRLRRIARKSGDGTPEQLDLFRS